MVNKGGAKQTLKELLKPFTIFLLNVGFSPNRIIGLRHYPRYRSQASKFRRLGGHISHRYPILTDYDAQAGTASGHYFHQDLLVASFIHSNNPTRHIDIGSRIDGFVAHVASFRKIEVIDVRSLNSAGHDNISFINADLMDQNSVPNDMADSISCLHAIEHFGLGRYGDPVDPSGHIKGFNNILRMLKLGGVLYISFPIGKQNEVHFNAHRVFHPKDIFSWPANNGAIKLARFDFVDDEGSLHQNANIDTDKVDVIYGCGIYTFIKTR